ncbi:MAG: EamA family transporter [Clostridiales bacterium]|nr:EamA family transporter [Clostridiales bacterium]
MKYFFLCLLNVISLVTGQVLFKVGTNGKTIDSTGALIKTVFSPLIFSGLILYVFTTMLWLYILSKMPISRAYPIQALAYPLVLILAQFIFNEHITTTRWIGMGIVFAGVIIVAQ